MECVPLDCHRFTAHSLFRLPDWRHNVRSVKSVLEWMFQLTAGRAHLSCRSFCKNLLQIISYLNIYFKHVYCIHNRNNNTILWMRHGIWCYFNFFFIYLLLELGFNSKLRNAAKGKREEPKSQQRKWRMPPKRLVNLLFVFLGGHAKLSKSISFTNLNKSFFNKAPFRSIWIDTIFVNKFNDEIFHIFAQALLFPKLGVCFRSNGSNCWKTRGQTIQRITKGSWPITFICTVLFGLTSKK